MQVHILTETFCYTTSDTTDIKGIYLDYGKAVEAKKALMEKTNHHGDNDPDGYGYYWDIKSRDVIE